MRCDQCDSKITGTPVKTATRTLCTTCGDRLDGLTAGVIAGGSVGEAIATAGWYTSLRERRREARKARDQKRTPGSGS